ncbi:Ig-like domain-containing protein [Bacillus thuringiensis]
MSIQTTYYYSRGKVRLLLNGVEVQQQNIPTNKNVSFLYKNPIKFHDRFTFQLLGDTGQVLGSQVVYLDQDANYQSSQPILNRVKDTDEFITGRVENKSYKHVVSLPGGKGILVASDGIFKIPITKQPAGTKLTVYSYHDTTNCWDYSTSGVTVEKTEDEVAPTTPEVNPVTDADTQVTGKATASSTVSIKVGDQEIGQGQADGNGTYTITIPKQTAGTTLSVTASNSAGTSAATTVTVKEKLTASTIEENTLNVNITRLRKKFNELGIENAIETVRGLGYCFNATWSE